MFVFACAFFNPRVRFTQRKNAGWSCGLRRVVLLCRSVPFGSSPQSQARATADRREEHADEGLLRVNEQPDRLSPFPQLQRSAGEDTREDTRSRRLEAACMMHQVQQELKWINSRQEQTCAV